MIDGWAFLGRAIDSAFRRDPYSAIHFAYYAEMRAAMALFAVEGIGIFDNKHPVIRSSGAPARLTDVEIIFGSKTTTARGTHGILWPYLRHWATLQRAVTLLDLVIAPAGIELSEWLRLCNAAVPSRAVAQSWFRSWGVDLAVIPDDKNLRNLASYRPSEYRTSSEVSVSELLEFFESLWTLFEPSEGRRFPKLEACLLRQALRTGGISRLDAAKLEGIGLSASEAIVWSQYFDTAADPLLIVEAGKTSSIDGERCHLQVIARATLLLFLATGAAKELLASSTYSRDDLGFWWKRMGRTRGIWSDMNEPANPLDVWADMQLSVIDARNFAKQSPLSTLHAWRRSQPQVVNDLGRAETISLWGLMP